MIETIESLVGRFASGALSRRELVQAFAALAALPAAPASLKANSLNHVTLAVSDPERSRQFYETLLAVGVVSRQSNGINLGLGTSFLGLYQIANPGRIDHFCVGVDEYEIQETARRLRRAGVEPTIRQDRPELYFRDPDGIRIQLSAKDYRG